ncbi:Gfo/Idh/MocA family protein [Marinobacter halotolerans]|uniref:Gfo/Idh/MocA family protein n=1 Tax=Marinobacter halotolerans TaxID=1569211 RepID=UPI001245F0BB|nr:Gfo/Idh/MocA family oxidoreductase [Marinobacter halotolerans]
MENRNVRWGIIGTAEIATKVVAGMHDAANAEVVAVASRALDRAQAWAKEHNVPQAYGSYDELLADDSIDAVYLPVPTALRNEWIKKAARAGKHVYAEKPLADGVEEAIAVCKENGVQFMDGTMWLHSTRTKELEKHIANGDIGDVKRVTSAFTFKAPSKEWYEGGNGRTDKTREPMGCFGDQGWYPIAATMWSFGYELPERVQMTHVSKNSVDTIVACGGTLWFSNGRMATFDAGCELAHRSQFETVGDAGLIRVNDLVGGQGRTGNFAAYGEKFTGSTHYVLGDVEGKDTELQVPACDHVVKLVERFSNIVLTGKLEDEWPKRSTACHRVMSALFESAESGRAVYLANH